MEIGPVQLVVISFDNIDRFKGQIMAELDAVRSRGVIRLIDALAVARTANGDVVAIEDSDFSAAEVAEIGSAIRMLTGMDSAESVTESSSDLAIDKGIGLTPADIRNVAESIEPGSAMLYLLIEHTWAIGLKEAVRGVGGVPVVQGFLTPEAMLMVGAELRAVLEAEATIELAEAVKGAAILDALITVEVAQEVTDAAMQAAGEAIMAAEAIRAAAAAEAVRALIVAGLIEEAAAEEAAEALAAAELISEAALEEARASAAETEAEVRELAATAAD